MSLPGKIRGFLLQQPKPASVRVTGEGEPQELRPGRSYVKCAETIAALDGQLLECLDSAGNLLRAMRLNDEEAARSEAAPIPVGLNADPHALMLTHFANLLHRAYEHSTEIAFVKMVEAFDKMNDRSESIEQRLERAEAHNRRMVIEQAEEAVELAREQAEVAVAGGGGDLLSQMAASYLQAQSQKPSVVNQKNGNGKGQA